MIRCYSRNMNWTDSNTHSRTYEEYLMRASLVSNIFAMLRTAIPVQRSLVACLRLKLRTASFRVGVKHWKRSVILCQLIFLEYSTYLGHYDDKYHQKMGCRGTYRMTGNTEDMTEPWCRSFTVTLIVCLCMASSITERFCLH